MTPASTLPAQRADRRGPVPSHGHPYLVRTLRPDERPDWDRALTGSPQDCVFLRSTWLDALDQALGWRIIQVGCFEQDRLVGGLCGRLSSEGGRNRLDRILLVPYNGCWMVEGPAQLPHRIEHRRHAILSALATHVRDRFDAAVIDLHPTNVDTRPFVWNGWQTSVRYTFVNDLTRVDASQFAPSIRRRASKAAASSVRFDRRVPPQAFIELWTLSLDRQDIRPPIAPESLRRLVEDLPRRGIRCEIFGARLAEGDLVAANAVLYDRTMAYYWLAGFDPDEPYHGAANQLCHVETLREVGRHVKRFDWVGANTPSIAAYKQGFSPDLVPTYRLTWTRPKPDAVTTTARTFRRWLRSCPLLAARPAGLRWSAPAIAMQPVRVTQLEENQSCR